MANNTHQLIQKLQQINGMLQNQKQTANNLVVNPNANVYQQAIMDAQQIRDIAMEQARTTNTKLKRSDIFSLRFLSNFIR